jgi:hypothetical protein
MMYRLAADHPRSDNLSLVAILPIRNATFAEIENQFSYALLDVFIQILDCSLEECSPYLQKLLFLGDPFRLDEKVGVEKKNRIHRSLKDGSLELTDERIFDHFFVTDVLLSVFVESSQGFAVHDLDQQYDTFLLLLESSVHARVLISYDFVGI